VHNHCVSHVLNWRNSSDNFVCDTQSHSFSFRPELSSCSSLVLHPFGLSPTCQLKFVASNLYSVEWVSPQRNTQKKRARIDWIKLGFLCVHDCIDERPSLFLSTVSHNSFPPHNECFIVWNSHQYGWWCHFYVLFVYCVKCIERTAFNHFIAFSSARMICTCSRRQQIE